MSEEYLRLKWGTLKAWKCVSEKSKAALQKYFDDGVSMSAMLQEDTENQKQALLELIDAIDGKISNDWTGETLTKDEAKKYVLEYNQ